MRSYLLSLLWIIPFISFLAGYQLIRVFSDHGAVAVPSVVGQHIHDAIKLLSGAHLNTRILNEKEDSDLPEGIVISQSPAEGKKIKSHQSIFLVVTRKPPKPRAPNLFGLTLDEAQSMVKTRQANLKAYDVESVNPQGACIAQSIQSQEELSDGVLTAYFSDGMTPIRVMPSFVGKRLTDVAAFLKEQAIHSKVEHLEEVAEEHRCDLCIVKTQQPQAGSLINLKKPLTLTLSVVTQ